MASLQELNRSELVLQCRELGYLDAHREMSRDALIGLLLSGPGKKKLPVLKTNLDRVRIMSYVLEHWDQVQPFVAGCPARSGSPTACFNCSDLQVTYCFEENNEIPSTTKEKEREMTQTQPFTPRTAAEWKTISESSDATEKSLLAKGLMALGMSSKDIGSLTREQRVAKVMELQDAKGLTPKTGAKKPAPAAAAAKTGAKKPAPAKAAPEPEEEPEEEETEAESVEVDFSPVTEKIAELEAKLDEANRYITDTNAMLKAIFIFMDIPAEAFEECKGTTRDEDLGNA